ncbi:MAG: hypothetical protein ABJK59_13395 [Erythrobacter sp.]|uniref:hypothetical protein n=1 Tax=Erythrobacter sp. TaxID=1042 RepID=UPI003296C6CF
MITATILSASLSAVPLMCNTVDANGVVAPYSISVTDNQKLSIVLKRIGSGKSELIEVIDFDQSEAAQPTFSAEIGGRKLAFRLWGGFHRPMSQIDAVDKEGETRGLRFLSGTCSQGAVFRPVEHKFSEPRYPTVDGRKVQNCFGATIDGRVFVFREKLMENRNSEVLFRWGGSGDQFQKTEVSPEPFPSLPRREGIHRTWTAYDPTNEEKSPAFVEEFSVNEETLRAAVTFDFVSLEDVDGPLMVARAHCGQFTVKKGG